MRGASKIINEMKGQGLRTTRTRSTIVELLVRADHALSVPELLIALHRKRLKVNKTTIYREVEFLLSRGVVRLVQLSRERASFELMSKGHHHHVICTQCERVEEVEIKEIEMALKSVESHFERKKEYAGVSHSLEFFGVCILCARD